MDLNIQVYVPVYLWVYSTYLTFCNSNCYLKGLYKAVAFASDDGSVKSTGQAMGRKRGQKVAETKNNLELISFKWNPMRMNWNFCPFFIPLTSMLCMFPQKPEPFKKLNTKTWPRSRRGWMRIQGRWSNCRSGLCPPVRWAADWQQRRWYKMAAAVPSYSISQLSLHGPANEQPTG